MWRIYFWLAWCRARNFGQNIFQVPKTKVSSKLVLITTLAVIGGFLFGYDTGVISGANLYLKVQFKMTTAEQEAVVSVTVGAAALFSLVGGIANERLGRKLTILISSILFILGSIFLGVAYSFRQLIIGRLIVGTAIGISSSTIPMYIAETSPSHVRGVMITMFQLMITFGLFMASVIDAAFSYIEDNNLNWRLMLAFPAIPAALQFFGFLFVPESPRWLVSKGRMNEAYDVLKSVNGSDEINAKHELSLIKTNHDETERARTASGETIQFLVMLQSPTIRKAVIIGCVLQMFQQLSGVNTIMYYAATVIQMGGIRNNTLAIWLAAVVTAVNFFCTFIGVYLVDRIGRRLLLLGSILGVIAALVFLVVSFLVIAMNSPNSHYVELNPLLTSDDSCATITNCDKCSYNDNCGWCFDKGNVSKSGSCVAIYDDVNQTLTVAASQWANYGKCASTNMLHSGGSLMDSNAVWDFGFCPTSYSWLPIFGMVLYLCSFSAGFGPVPWIICAEIFPNWARSTGTSITTASNWFFNLVISLTFLSLANAVTRQGAYFVYASVTFVGMIFCYLLIPETKNKEIEEIEELLRGPWFHCGHAPKKPADGTYYNTMFIDDGCKVEFYNKSFEDVELKT